MENELLELWGADRKSVVFILNPAGSGPQSNPYPPTSENAQGLFQLQMQNPGPPPGLGAVPPPPNN